MSHAEPVTVWVVPRSEAGPGALGTLVFKRDGERLAVEPDLLAVEEPLEIRILHEPAERGDGGPEDRGGRFLVTMRTPGDDEDLITGLLFAERVLTSASDLVSLSRLTDPRIDPELARNVFLVGLTPRAREAAARFRRATVMSSACGVCGRTSIEDVLKLRREPSGTAPPTEREEAGLTPIVEASVLTRLPAALRERQSIFASTGGLHAAAFFDTEGRMLLIREDIGRHNAVDKAIGAILRAGIAPPAILLVSGRLGFEIVEKAVLAGVPIVAAVSAPTSLAVALADEAGLTLVGFLRGERFNVYAHPSRIALVGDSRS